MVDVVGSSYCSNQLDSLDMKSWLKWKDTIQNVALITQRLIQANNLDRATKLLKAVQGIDTQEKKEAFDEALKELKNG